MTNKNLALSVLGLIILFGLGYFLISSNDTNPQLGESNNIPPGENVNNEPVEPADNVSFGDPVVMKAKEEVKFSDGLTLILKEINDSTCKPGVVCIWQGEISGTFAVSGGKLSGSKEIFLGTERNKNVVIGDYTFTLVKATATEITFTVSYAKTATGGPCYVGGCSSQLCSDQPDMASTCEFKEEYACYKKNSTCERQPSGQCGWTPNAALSMCLNNAQ